LKLGTGSDPSSTKWAVDPAVARLRGNELVRVTERVSSVSLTAVLPETNRRQDRVYAPALFFEDRSIAVLSSLFDFSAEDGKPQCTHFVAPPRSKVGAGDEWGRSSIDSDASVPGYVVFGNPEIEYSGAMILVLDKAAPPWAKEKMAQILESAIGLYAAKMGPQPLPPIIIYAQSTIDAAPYHWGDRLPGSITLGLLGKGWLLQSQTLEEQLSDFLAHEVFHVWNARVNFVGDGDSLLALEGGAELASVFARSKTAPRPASFALNKVSEALNQCQFDLAYGSSLHDLLQSQHPGQAPYHCGMVVMFAATASLGVGPEASEEFFKSWKSVLSDTRDKTHLWSDLVVKEHRSEKLEDLDRAIATKGAFIKFLKKALTEDAYMIEPVDNLSLQTKKQLAAVIVANLMRLDCAGEVSLWSEEGGFRIDDKIQSCNGLRPGATITGLLGEKPWDDPVYLARKIQSLCQKGSSISIDYSGGGATSLVKCNEPFPDVPAPVKIVKR
jgi:hypothetical protein